ncbi:phosphate starvation-inducible protein [Bacillus phage Eldridge]|uniref:Phosphate starvation-inducible protein n=1 Tax=Bacillus phage Eldridge TaxID=1776293 RepID=A0A0Y0AF28_9CAUD|nr:phosphate starvation-inducible protein [Bacillus phage Eldridge]AMB18614.1 phosphate starvation-inducible protein [Bacillus phage Eldridge]
MVPEKPLDLSKLSPKEFKLVRELDRDQEDMVIKLFNKKRVIVDAKAGSGKTSVMAQAMKALRDKGYIKQVYYVLFPVQEKALGYIPGGLAEKIKEYAVPFIDALVDAGVNPQELIIEDMCNPLVMGDYKIVPHTFLRGRTIDDAGLIIDEIQNGTISELKKTLTRVDDSCYVAMTGHDGQQDIKNSGFAALKHHFKQGVASGEFTGVEFAELHRNYRGLFSQFSDKLGELK